MGGAIEVYKGNNFIVELGRRGRWSELAMLSATNSCATSDIASPFGKT